jgi:hypothetical protein
MHFLLQLALCWQPSKPSVASIYPFEVQQTLPHVHAVVASSRDASEAHNTKKSMNNPRSVLIKLLRFNGARNRITRFSEAINPIEFRIDIIYVRTS